MELPQEIEVRYTIPAIRRSLAQALVGKGMTQKEVARLLDVTEAAVSQYLSNKRGTPVEYPKDVAAALASAAAALAAKPDPFVVRKTIIELAERMKHERVICQIHRKHANIGADCSSCYE